MLRANRDIVRTVGTVQRQTINVGQHLHRGRILVLSP